MSRVLNNHAISFADTPDRKFPVEVLPSTAVSWADTHTEAQQHRNRQPPNQRHLNHNPKTINDINT